jgi:outer membrane protein assembly factor BamD
MIRLSIALRLFLFVALALSLGGCKTIGGWFGDAQEETETLPVEQLYAKSKDYQMEGSHSRAIRYYQRLVARFPFGPYSEQSQLELVYSQYKTGKFEDATNGIDRFIRTYPRHPHIDYAYYLKALINFDRESGWLKRLARIDMSQRDLSSPTVSFNDFNEVIRRYPNSRYAADARQRMVYLRNVLARHDLVVGLYYYRRGAWVSAANRGKYVLETYPQSEYDGDAIALMAASYGQLGEDTLSADAKRVLQQNYPEHPYLSGDWPKKKGLWRQLNPVAGEYK